MHLTKARLVTRSAIGCALLASAVLLFLPSGWFGAHGSPQTSAAAPRSNAEYLHAAAGIDGRIQSLRQFEREMLAQAAVPQKAAFYRQRREAARQRIDELMRQADLEAGSDEERRRLDQLAALTRLADARFTLIDRSFIQPNGDIR